MIKKDLNTTSYGVVFFENDEKMKEAAQDKPESTLSKEEIERIRAEWMEFLTLISNSQKEGQDDGIELFFESDEEVLIENKDMLRIGGPCSDCPVGWGVLVRQLFKDIRAVCKKNKSALPLVAQVKSKFGRLCFYLDYESRRDGNYTAADEVNQLIQQAAEKSGTICEITGLPGCRHVKHGWYATLNENIGKKHGYTKV